MKLTSSALFPDLEADRKYFFPVLWLLSLLSYVYLGLVLFNTWLFKKGFKKVTTLSMPVISVGNLTVGGTGKTPILIYLANLLQSQGTRVGIVSRNYKAASAQIVKVEPGKSDDVADGKRFGDEPLLIFQKTGVPVYVGPKKVETAKAIVRNEKIDAVFIDDGFQHLRLKKNCNILLCDVTQMDEENHLIPRGRYREPLSGYQKANIIFWTKTNFIPSERLAEIKKMISFSGLQVDWTFELTQIEFPNFPQLNFAGPKRMQIGGKNDFTTVRRFVLVSAIARPEYFKKIVQDLNPKYEVFEKKFRDHHQYTEADVKLILNKPVNFHHFLTTEKDYTKLKDIWPSDVPLGIVKWEPRPNVANQTLYETITSFLH
ncbi:MAG: tetraacyldisaccharide 4'-kinase [Bdellovibrionaceae bacterium]|nr:tetraacyldisaccharide 4'-kinase [Pseudobdellovibrionaceae bacterium]